MVIGCHDHRRCPPPAIATAPTTTTTTTTAVIHATVLGRDDFVSDMNAQ